MNVPRRLLVAALAAAFFTLGPAGAVARAEGEGGPDGTQGVEEKIKAKMEEIVRLMRENEKALLEASRGSGKKPEGPNVPLPEGTPSGTPPAPGTPPPGGPPAPTPPAGGEEARKHMEELLKAAGESSGRIPHELEELVRMIPVQQGGGGGGSESDPNPEKNREGEARHNGDVPKPEDAEGGMKPEGPKEPRDPAKKPQDGDGTAKPPEGAKGDPERSDVPPWLVDLPSEVRRMITNGDGAEVPARYRAVYERYLKWINDKAKAARPR